MDMDETRPDQRLAPRPLPEMRKNPPAAGRVLVLAPHPDDETIGMGGTMILHRSQGDTVEVLFLTRGIAGDAEGRYDPETYAALRRSEGEAAGRVLGVDRTWAWEYPDNRVVTEADMAVLVPRLARFMEEGGYEVVYTPHLDEIHSDHHVSAVAALRALEGLSRPPTLFGYEVWTPLRAEVVVDVSGVFDRKLEAARCYATQTAVHDITRLFRCLNGYRAVVLENKEGYGEAFLRMA